MILITGATGTVGSEIVKQMAAKNVPARAFVRDAEKSKVIAAAEIEISVGDFEQPETLDAALKGVETAFLLPANSPRQVEQSGNFIRAAVRAKTPFVVKLSNFAPDINSSYAIARSHAETERDLAESGLSYALLRPNFFMQNLFGFAAAIKQGKFSLPAANSRISMIDVRDIAAVAVAVLTAPAKHAGQKYQLTGAQALTFADVAAELSAATGKTVIYENLSDEEFKNQQLSAGISEAAAETSIKGFQGFRAGQNEIITDSVEKLIGKPPTSFGEFARNSAEKFR